MKQMKKVYGHFDLLKKNGEQGLTKVTYSSLDKYNKSPYLQRVAQQHSTKKRPHDREMTPIKGIHEPIETIESKKQQKTHEAKEKYNNSHQLPKIGNSIKYKDVDVISYFKTQLDSIDNPLVKESKQIPMQEMSVGSHSATLQVHSNKKKKLEPIQKVHKMHYAIKTKAGTTGKQTKINQDIAIAETKLPFGMKLFCVCDGHGLNGHLVSAFIKANLIKNLNSSLKKTPISPTLEEMKQIIYAVFLKTNQSLLDCDINTELSGSTVVAIFIYNQKIISFNVGDSRAILVKQLHKDEQSSQNSYSKQITEKSKDYSNGFHSNRPKNYEWKVEPLSNDQKPERPDQRERILQAGGRVFCQTTQKGEQIGPMRVWMKDVQMPGLAMTRSFGDKAGIKAGTNGIPQILEFDLTQEDKFMIVASDGLWQYLQNEEVMNFAIPFYLKDDLDMGGERLVKISTEIWHKVSLSRDDITVILISLHAPSQK